MSQTLTYVTEIAVGFACLVGAGGLGRARRLPWLAVLLAVAGVVAAAHGILELAT
ncbi:MAG: hypothetical protein ACRDHU_09205 [Actinomycetota bacterium]